MEFHAVAKLLRRVSLKSILARYFLSELLGTYILVTIENGATAQKVLSDGREGSFLSIQLSMGMGFIFAIFASGPSGSHLNPAVSLAYFMLGKLSIVHLFVYVLSQFLASFSSALTIYLVYIDAFKECHRINKNNTRVTAGIFASYPKSYLSIGNAFGDQFFAACLFMIGVLAINDPNNIAPPHGIAPLFLGLTVSAIAMSFGMNTGAAINPAGDLASRIFSAIAGWKWNVFEPTESWFWIPVVAPCCGTVIGALVYELCVGVHIEKSLEKTNSNSQ